MSAPILPIAVILVVVFVVGLTMVVFAMRSGGGATSPDAGPTPPATMDSVRAALGGGDKIGAIRLYREVTGAGLADAKSAVEAMERGESPPSPQRAGAALPAGDAAAVRAALRSGNKIEAIKLYRAATGAGLADAKAAVEAMERE